MDINNIEKYFWQGEKIRVRPVTIEDWEPLYNDSMDSEGVRYLNLGINLPISKEIAKQTANELVNSLKNIDHTTFGIEIFSGELVGVIAMHKKDFKNGTFGVGIKIFKPYRQKGYGEDALRIILRYGFYELRFQKCNMSCIDTNGGSIRLQKKVGFVEEGRQRRMIYTNGKYYDYLLFGLMREEFERNDVRNI